MRLWQIFAFALFAIIVFMAAMIVVIIHFW